MSNLDPKEIIKSLDLQPHPEGGYFKETFRDEVTVDGRSVSTGIYFLIEAGNFSNLHKIDATEGWHFYAGDAFEVIELDESGPTVTRLGIDFSKGEVPQYYVKAGRWFGSKPAQGSSWALVGCTVAPGFVFEKFELAKRSDLLKLFPNCKDAILALTPEE